MAKEKDKKEEIIEEAEEKLDIEDIQDPEEAEKSDPIDLEEAVSEEEDHPEEPKKEELKEEIKESVITEEPKAEKLPKMKKPKKPFPTKSVIVVVTTMLITAALVLGGVYYYLNYWNKKEEPKTEESNTQTQEETKKEEVSADKYIYVTEPTGLNLREDPNPSGKLIVLMPYGSKLKVIKEENGWIQVDFNGKTGWCSKEYTSEKNPLVYQNTEYKFEITFPETWAGYKIVKKSMEGATAVYYVLLPTTDKNWKDSNAESGYASLMAFSVYTKAQYDTAKAAEGGDMLGSPTATKGDYVFIASSGQATPSDLEGRFPEITSIIKTLKVT